MKLNKVLIASAIVTLASGLAHAEDTPFSVTTATGILTAGLITVGLIAGGGSALKGGVAVFNKVIGMFKRST